MYIMLYKEGKMWVDAVLIRSVEGRGFLTEMSNCSCLSCTDSRQWNSRTQVVVLLSREKRSGEENS